MPATRARNWRGLRKRKLSSVGTVAAESWENSCWRSSAAVSWAGSGTGQRLATGPSPPSTTCFDLFYAGLLWVECSYNPSCKPWH